MICHPLAGVCTVLNLVGRSLEQRSFSNPALTEELLPKSTPVIYKSANDTTIREDALPIVAYSTGALTFTPKPFTGPVSGNGTMTSLNGELIFKISTTNEALTSELAVEIASTIVGNAYELRSFEFYLAQIVISPVEVENQRYYIAVVRVGASLGMPVWKSDKAQGILREIHITLGDSLKERLSH